MDKLSLIKRLGLEPHIEGGYYRRSYQSPISAGTPGRPLMSSIFYLLTNDSPIGHFHRNRSDIMHYWHAGESLCYWLIDPAGQLTRTLLGPGEDEHYQLLVPGGYWKATQLVQGEFGLLSEAVTPGFDFADMQLAGHAQMETDFPALYQDIFHLIKN